MARDDERTPIAVGRAERSRRVAGDILYGLMPTADLGPGPPRTGAVEFDVRVCVIADVVSGLSHGQRSAPMALYVSSHHEEGGRNFLQIENLENPVGRPRVRSIIEGEIRDRFAGSSADHTTEDARCSARTSPRPLSRQPGLLPRPRALALQHVPVHLRNLLGHPRPGELGRLRQTRGPHSPPPLFIRQQCDDGVRPGFRLGLGHQHGFTAAIHQLAEPGDV